MRTVIAVTVGAVPTADGFAHRVARLPLVPSSDTILALELTAACLMSVLVAAVVEKVRVSVAPLI